MSKVAIPVLNEVLSTSFNNCGYYYIFEIDHKQIVSQNREILCHKTSQELNTWVAEKGITDLIVHGIDKSSVDYFADTKVNLFIGVNINEPGKLIEDYLKGTLQSNTKVIH